MYRIVNRVMDGCNVYAYIVQAKNESIYTLSLDDTHYLAQNGQISNATLDTQKVLHCTNEGSIASIKTKTIEELDTLSYTAAWLAVEIGARDGDKLYEIIGLRIGADGVVFFTSKHEYCWAIEYIDKTVKDQLNWVTEVTEQRLRGRDIIVVGGYDNFNGLDTVISGIPEQDTESHKVGPILRMMLKAYKEAGMLRPFEVKRRIRVCIDNKFALYIGYEIYNHGHTMSLGDTVLTGKSGTMVLYSDIKTELGALLVDWQAKDFDGSATIASGGIFYVNDAEVSDDSVIDVRDTNGNLRPEFNSIEDKVARATEEAGGLVRLYNKRQTKSSIPGHTLWEHNSMQG